MNILQDFKVLSRSMQKWIQTPACSAHGLHRILSFYWLAHCYLMKKSTKVQLFFGSDCGMVKFFTLKSQPKGQLMSLPHFWGTVWRKRSRHEHMQTVNRTSRRIRGLFARSGSKKKLNSYQIFKIKNKKLKTYSGWCPFKGLSNDTTLMQIQSGRTVPLILALSFFSLSLSFYL